VSARRADSAQNIYFNSISIARRTTDGLVLIILAKPSRNRSLWSFGVQSQQLLTEGEIFKDEVTSGTESTDKPSEEMSERHDES
jgi:hypothetical protein